MVVPIPEAASLERLTTKDLTAFLIFCFAFGFCFLIVAIKVAPLFAAGGLDKPRIWQVFPDPKSNWSDVNSWVLPSAPIREYLFALKGWKLSFVGNVGTGVSNLPSLILTENVFLITTDAPVRSTLDIFLLGSLVYNVLSLELSNWVAKTFKSLTSLNWFTVETPEAVVGNPPLNTPFTVVTPTTETEVASTLITLAKIGSSDIARSLYDMRFPIVVIPGKLGFVLCILVPAAPLSTPTVETPTLSNVEGITFALKVLRPTVLSSVP